MKWKYSHHDANSLFKRLEGFFSRLRLKGSESASLKGIDAFTRNTVKGFAVTDSGSYPQCFISAEAIS